MKANIIDNWLKENTNPEIDKQVENEYKEIMSKEAKDKAEEFYYCQLQIEQEKWCKKQCYHCKEYYKPLEQEILNRQ